MKGFNYIIAIVNSNEMMTVMDSIGLVVVQGMVIELIFCWELFN